MDAMKDKTTIDGVDGLISQISVKGTKYEIQDANARAKIQTVSDTVDKLANQSDLDVAVEKINQIINEIEKGSGDLNSTDGVTGANAWVTLIDKLSELQWDTDNDGTAESVTVKEYVGYYNAAEIAKLDAEKSGTSTSQHVTVNVKETDGIITEVTVTDSDIASAATVDEIGKVLNVSDFKSTADGTTTYTTVKTYVDNAVANKNVSAEGDSYVSATAAANKVTVSATDTTKNAIAAAHSSVQSLKVNNVDATVAGNNNAKAATVTITGSDITVSATDDTTLATVAGVVNVSDFTNTTVKTYVDNAVANKNVSASSTSQDYITATAADNAVTIGATAKTTAAITAAESSIQSLTVNGVEATVDGNTNAKAATVTITGSDIAVASDDETTITAHLEDVEKATAASLNDLNDRIDNLETMDSTVTGASDNITVTVTQTDGKLSAVTVEQDNLATIGTDDDDADSSTIIGAKKYAENYADSLFDSITVSDQILSIGSSTSTDQ